MLNYWRNRIFVQYFIMEIPVYEEIGNQEGDELVVKQQEDEDDFVEGVSWKEMCLKSDLYQAVLYFFPRPSQVQIRALPPALGGKDIVCQARSGTGKTAVYIISILNQIDQSQLSKNICIVITSTRQLAHQICKNFRKITQKMKKDFFRVGCYFGGIDINAHREQLQSQNLFPHIVIGTPGRLKQLAKQNFLQYQNCKYFVLDECDILIKTPSIKKDILFIFEKLPYEKQVFLVSATISSSTKTQLLGLTRDPSEINVNESQKISLVGLKQFYLSINQDRKIPQLFLLLDNIPFNQVIIFMNKRQRAQKLNDILRSKLFNPICIHSGMSQEARLISYDGFKNNKSRMLIATDLFGRGIDIARVNFIINFDFPFNLEGYLHRIGRAGRFGGKGLIINFINMLEGEMQNQEETFNKIQAELQIPIEKLPQNFDISEFLT